MIEYRLRGLHPTYERIILDIFDELEAEYRRHALMRVELYESAGDRSLGNSDRPGIVQLNRYWFGQPIEALQEASRDTSLVYVHGSLPLYWHGSMPEPQHVLVHEYGHCLQNVFPRWRGFAEGHWAASCADPVNCRPVSGYALTSPDEWWADTFAAMHLREGCEATRLMRELWYPDLTAP